ncbi:MAG: D-aminoacyl-tRNA deacylase [Candidatus Falkowbacteria bacterium]|nr:D-aminoacyl-tRNA deacylase [Candidatus Falkowbacteria bacterium]
MRAVIQRVTSSRVLVKEEIVGEIGSGLLILLAIHNDDEELTLDKLAEKIINLRIFEDEFGKINLSLKDVVGEAMVVSQFTLYGKTEKGNRPSFLDSARPDKAKPFYDKFVELLAVKGIKKVATGKFGALMSVQLINEGPTTIIIDL